MPDRRTILRAFVRPAASTTPGDDLTVSLKTYIRQTLLPHKAPRDFIYLEDLPKTGTGKIDRQALLRLRGNV